MAHQKLTVAYNGNVAGQANTYSYSGSFDVFKGTEVVALLDNVKLTYTASTINESASPREYTVDTVAKTIHIGGADLSSGVIIIRPETDVKGSDAPTPRATYTPGSSITSDDLNNNQLQLLRKSIEYEDQKLSSTGGTMTGDLTMGEDTKIIFEGATDDGYETTLTVTDPTADRTITLPNVTGTVVTTGDTGSVAHAMLAGDAVDGDNIADDSVNSEHYVDGSIDLAHLSANSVNSSKIVDDSIVNADINSSAAIAHSKLANVTSGQILVGNGSNVPTAVAVSGDATLANNGAVTIATGAVEHAMLAGDAVDGDNIADDSVNSEHYVAGSIDHEHLANDIIDGDNIANDAVSSEHIVDGAIVNAAVANDAAIAHSKLANVTDGQILVGNGSNVPTAVAVSGDVTIANTGAVTIANDAVEIAMIGCEQTTISDSDSHIPTSGAVVDYVAAQIAPIGGLEVIADDESFPNTIPAAGVVISITDAAGLQINSSGVSTNGDTLDNSTVTINGFPSALRGGVGSNADPYVLGSGSGLMVQSTGSSQTYNYHKALLKESDYVQLSDDINDFNSRYRVAGSAPGSSNDEGDLYFDTGTNKMYVYDGSSWGEVTSTGDFKYLVLCVFNSGTGNAGVINGSISKYDLRETSTSGSLASITSAAQLTVSIDGVIQKPNTGTAIASNDGFCMVDGHTIEFGANIPSGSEVFIIQSGSALTINTPGDGTVSAAKIAAGAVITAKIGADAVDGTKIADDAIDSEHYTNASIDHVHLANDCVDGDNIADDAINSEHYVDASIDHQHLANDCVDGDNIADDAVNSEHYVDASIDHQHLADDCVDGDNIADNSVTLAHMAGGTDGQIITYDASGDPVAVGPGTDGQVLTSTGAGSPPAFETISTTDTLSFRNLIINGAMRIAQRGTSTTTEGAFTLDRWKVGWAGQDEAQTVAQHALTSSDTGPWAKGFRYSLHITNGNQSSGAGASDDTYIKYVMEDQDLCTSGWDYTDSNSKATLSFWVKASVAQTYYVILETRNGTSRQFSFDVGVSADTWTKITQVIPGDSSFQCDNNNGEGLHIYFVPFYGTGKTSSGHTIDSWHNTDGGDQCPDMTSTWWTTNDSTFEITGVQFEVGAAATEFEHRSYHDELISCQRYYYAHRGTLPGESRAGDDLQTWVTFPVVMRTTPSRTQEDGSVQYYNRLDQGNSTSATTYTYSGMLSAREDLWIVRPASGDAWDTDDGRTTYYLKVEPTEISYSWSAEF